MNKPKAHPDITGVIFVFRCIRVTFEFRSIWGDFCVSHKLGSLSCSVFLGALSSPILSGLSGAPCYLGPPSCSVLSQVTFAFRSIWRHSRVSPDFGRCRVKQKYKNANKQNTKTLYENSKEQYNNEI